MKDKMVIQINLERHWFFAAVDSTTSDLLHVRLFQTRTTRLTIGFLRELGDKPDPEETTFLVDDAAHLASTLDRPDCGFE